VEHEYVGTSMCLLSSKES